MTEVQARRSEVPAMDPATALRFLVVVDEPVPREWQWRCVQLLCAQDDVCDVLSTGHRVGPSDRPSGRCAALGVARAADVPVVRLLDGLASHELAEPDVVLDLTAAGLPAALAGSRYETWRLRLPAVLDRLGVRELLGRGRTVSAGLERVRPDGTRNTMVSARYGLVRTSLEATRSRVLFGAATLPARASRAVRQGLTLPDAHVPDVHVRRVPALWRARLKVVLFARRWFKKLRDAVSDGSWAIGVVAAPIERFLDEEVPAESVVWHPGTGQGRYLADPFPLTSAPGVVLAEEFDRATGHGQLIATSYSADRGWSGRDVVARDDFHLSYPYPLELPDGVYCVPEAAQGGGLFVYRLDRPPQAARVTRMLDGVYPGDPTIIQWAGRWWLFYTDCLGIRDTDLFIWYADSCWGPWTPHALNPVKSDACSSRPAGTPFVRDGRLYRPAQDAAGTYGWRMVINEITALGPDRFDEHTVVTIGPFGRGRYSLGPHTLASAGSHTYLDGKRRVLSLPTTLRRKGRIR